MVRILSGERTGLIAFVIKGLLLPFVFIYFAVICFRYFFYKVGIFRTRRVQGIPVICVGNLSAGGTGKTPAVEFIARYLLNQNQKVAVISRGYGKMKYEQFNDEGKLLLSKLPDAIHIQNSNRFQAVTQALKLGASVAILDDGFSHLKLARDVNIVLIDATRPFSFFELLPRGLLREPPIALRRADAIIITRSNQLDSEVLDQKIRTIKKYIKPGALLLQAIHKPLFLKSVFDAKQDKEVYSFDEVAGKPVFAFAGTGNTASFFKTCRKIGLNIKAAKTFSDHFKYKKTDVENILILAKEMNAEFAITTSKDVVKIADFEIESEIPIYSLEVEFKIISEEEHKLFELIDSIVGSAE